MRRFKANIPDMLLCTAVILFTAFLWSLGHVEKADRVDVKALQEEAARRNR